MPDIPVSLSREPYWRGLGAWNFYFLVKLVLFWLGYLNLQIIPNLIFAAVLLMPLRYRSLRMARTILAIPVGVALFYQDTWLPPISRLANQPGVLDFSWLYALELLERIINWQLLGLLLALLIAYFYVRPWIRLTTLSLVGLGWLGLHSLALHQPLPHVLSEAVAVEQSAVLSADRDVLAPPDSTTLNDSLSRFYTQEASRVINFDPAAEQAAEPFDLLLINICSLAWDDLEAIGMRSNSLLQQMDIIFDNFNSATSYSGPAVKRLLRANCGQTSHDQLHSPVAEQCMLMSQLSQLGFDQETLLNHTGQFDDFLGVIQAQGNLPAPQLDLDGLRRAVIGFDGSPIWQDREVLGRWWQQRTDKNSPAVALLYNTTTLHDGNRILLPNGASRRASYPELASTLLDDLGAFIQQLERSGRRVAVVIVPEHGASLHGDRMQIAGMREIPSPSITHVPVGVKLINMGAASREEPVHINENSSYLALAELIQRLNTQDTPHWDTLTDNLPQTAWVSENEGTVVLEHHGQPHIRLKENGVWLPYPVRLP